MMSVVYSAHEEALVVNANHYNAANEPAWVVVDNVKTRIVEHGTEILFVNNQCQAAHTNCVHS